MSESFTDEGEFVILKVSVFEEFNFLDERE
jgi:hypothetical protein